MAQLNCILYKEVIMKKNNIITIITLIQLNLSIYSIQPKKFYLLKNISFQLNPFFAQWHTKLKSIEQERLRKVKQCEYNENQIALDSPDN